VSSRLLLSSDTICTASPGVLISAAGGTSVHDILSGRRGGGALFVGPAARQSWEERLLESEPFTTGAIVVWLAAYLLGTALLQRSSEFVSVHALVTLFFVTGLSFFRAYFFVKTPRFEKALTGGLIGVVGGVALALEAVLVGAVQWWPGLGLVALSLASAIAFRYWFTPRARSVTGQRDR